MRIGRDDSTVVERVPPASLRQRHLKRSPTSERGCARQPTPQRVRLCGSRQTHAGWWQARRVGRTHVAVAVAPAACAGLNHRQTRQRKRGQSQTLREGGGGLSQTLCGGGGGGGTRGDGEGVDPMSPRRCRGGRKASRPMPGRERGRRCQGERWEEHAVGHGLTTISNVGPSWRMA
eukprot:scaffold41496_cov26-Tisochrysis_lutea.AAC.7